MFALIREDLRRKAEWLQLPPTRRVLLKMVFTEGGACQLLYRLMDACHGRGWALPAMFICRLNAHLSNAMIGRGAEFGPGLAILHSFGIVVNSGVRAGRNLTLMQGVTLGMEKGRTPVLGDNVFVGAGAKVFGAVVVGSDVKIGANAVVTRDVPDGATVVGIPARVVRLYGEKVADGAE